jgi:hypothetical protein
VGAHTALDDLLGDRIKLRDMVERARVDACFCPDAFILIKEDRSIWALGECAGGACLYALRSKAVHAPFLVEALIVCGDKGPEETLGCLVMITELLDATVRARVAARAIGSVE